MLEQEVIGSWERFFLTPFRYSCHSVLWIRGLLACVAGDNSSISSFPHNLSVSLSMRCRSRVEDWGLRLGVLSV